MDTQLLRLLGASFSVFTIAGVAYAHPADHGSTDTPHDQATVEHETEDKDDSEHQHPHRPNPYNDPEKIASHGNGIGPDPDGDTNPATKTIGLSKIGDAAEASFDPPYRVVTFEAPPGSHNDNIIKQYTDKFGVSFSKGLSRQICEGQRYNKYDSKCTYLRAPSGQFAAAYHDEYDRPLRIDFNQPVCLAAMAIYPTGGKEGEEFEVTLQGYDTAENKLEPAKLQFSWTKDTFRWRHMAGAHFVDERANRIDVSMKSLDSKEQGKPVRFLIDDVAFIETACSDVADTVTTESLIADETETAETQTSSDGVISPSVYDTE